MMKKYHFAILFLGLTTILSLAFTPLDTTKSVKISKNNNTLQADSLLRHVVLFKFKEDTPAEKLKEIEDTFNALPSKIKEIHDYEWGVNNSPEGLNKGLTHCFFVTFKSEADRAIYLPHPDHKAFVEVASPYIEDVAVVDYWSR